MGNTRRIPHRNLGMPYEVPQGAITHQRVDWADQPGQHLWVVSAAWRVADPAAMVAKSTYLDGENIIAVGGPGCYKCEKDYSPELASQPCTGNTV